MRIETKEEYHLRYTRGSLITLSATFRDNGGQFTDPLNPKVTVLNFYTNKLAIKGFMNRITRGFYFYNIDGAIDEGRYKVIYSCSIVDENGYATEQTKEEVIDIVPITSKQILPIDPLSKLRIDLRDNNPEPSMWVWSDIELEEYLSQALSDMNITPPRTRYSWVNVPDDWIQCIKRGAQVRALYAKATEVAHQPLSYSDKGVSIDKRAQAQFYKTLADGIDTRYVEEKRIIKRNHYPRMGWVTTTDTPYMSLPPIRAISRIFF